MDKEGQVTEQPTPRMLTEKQVASSLGVEPITVRMWRWRDRKAAEAGSGTAPKAPPYVKLPNGQVRYPYDAFVGWLDALPRYHGVPQLPDNRRARTLEQTHLQPASVSEETCGASA